VNDAETSPALIPVSQLICESNTGRDDNDKDIAGNYDIAQDHRQHQAERESSGIDFPMLSPHLTRIMQELKAFRHEKEFSLL
jgi:hypothetical protein